MQELSLLEEKVVNGGALMMRHTEHSDSGSGGGAYEVAPGSSPRRQKEPSEFLEKASSKVDPFEAKYAGKKVKTASGEWVDFAPIR